MSPRLLFLIAVFSFKWSNAQQRIDSFKMYGDVKITMDRPNSFKKNKKTILIFFALPNGNTTEQTMGKKILPGDDWHFDIQHIKAQTAFIREQLEENIVVVYLENSFKSWPLWKQKHPAYQFEIPHIVDSVYGLISSRRKCIYLNGHSGGGSFIFGYLQGSTKISSAIERISFIDSDYGYDSSYYSKIKNWLQENRKATLTVFAYNDSIAIYNGKPIVSEKGGTWYRSHLMLQNLHEDFTISELRDDSLVVWESANRQCTFFLKQNPERKILHTQQVELNGFIHTVLYRTKKENIGYEYFGPRAYSKYIE